MSIQIDLKMHGILQVYEEFAWKIHSLREMHDLNYDQYSSGLENNEIYVRNFGRILLCHAGIWL